MLFLLLASGNPSGKNCYNAPKQIKQASPGLVHFVFLVLFLIFTLYTIQKKTKNNNFT